MPKNLGIDTFPDPVDHFGFCRRWGSAPFAARLVSWRLPLNKNMEVCKFSREQVCSYANIQVCKLFRLTKKSYSVWQNREPYVQLECGPAQLGPTCFETPYSWEILNAKDYPVKDIYSVPRSDIPTTSWWSVCLCGVIITNHLILHNNKHRWSEL